jgi:UDP-N-acetyl-D-glucosamine dehydrogenase
MSLHTARRSEKPDQRRKRVAEGERVDDTLGAAFVPRAKELLERLQNRSATVGVIGLGYVGLPIATAAAAGGFSTIGFDVDKTKPPQLNSGKSYIPAVKDEELQRLVSLGRFQATSAFDRLANCNVIVVCVPTPLTRHREPDLSYIQTTAITVAQRLRRGQLVILESTTYPGTTRDVLKPRLAATGLTSGSDYFIGFSPEREDPGNPSYSTAIIPKIVAGDGKAASELVETFYGAIVQRVVPVSSLEVAEAAKITENVFRAVNIALVNELKVIYEAMGIDIWEVIDAAKTKPFGYMPFYPGPGLGGHCIPIDPFYLTWKSREFELPTRFIELAGEINLAMPRYVVGALARALDSQMRVPLSAATILVVGLAYKKNVADIRESPSFKLMELLEGRGAKVDYHDPFVTTIPRTREHAQFAGRRSVELDASSVASCDAVLIATDHDSLDYGLLVEHARLIVDTRNVISRKGLTHERLVKA